MVFALIGIWGISTSLDHLALFAAIGLLGYGMRRFNYPIAPVLVGLILGPMAEKHRMRLAKSPCPERASV